MTSPRARSKQPTAGTVRRLRLTVLGVALAVAIPLSTAAPAYADSYPSWGEVQAAQKNAATAKAEYAKIAGLIGQLQQAASVAAADELKKQYEYSVAKAALDAQTAKLDSINTQASTAQNDAKQAETQYGKLASQLYISGGGSLTAKLLLSETSGSKGDDSNLLDQLGAVSQLTDHIAQLQSYAKQKQNVVTSLQAQAKQAESIRTSLEQDASAKYQAAQAAKAAADAALATQQKQGAILQAQAASLDKKAAAVLAEHNAGVARDEARQNALSSQQGDGGSNAAIGGSCTGGCSSASAQAYAQSAIGAYGWGSDQFSCLVDLWNHESGWQWDAYNSSSAAYGIPQSWPAEKMSSAGADYMTNGDTQIRWGLAYISANYGSPCSAWTFEMSHTPNWY
ncbi:coiled-coil domain-containing protein [Humibacter ginsenosidimutans]|uniref:Lytic transglycosylase domain-containing protein n=1 Tax=Humibacter ginsenosidimutans TaxID=2599293 RepID=A0A5B8M141_9MICO|nr:hypothetical protein [Humibacter ginsenosidimutans]QDZ13986.1 hypothetical protein FPZ11_03595 [Humibacter ginsenosidimutans]